MSLLFLKPPIVVTKGQQAANLAKGAISMFTTASDQLQKSNNLAEIAIKENVDNIKQLSQENDDMTNNISVNSVIIRNINIFLGKPKNLDKKNAD